MNRFAAVVVTLLLLICAVVSRAQVSAPAVEDKRVTLQWGVQIPMRDGVKLNATVYRPADQQSGPVVFTFTPYISDTYHDRAWYFARNGYVFALVDVRGRGNSEGQFEPFVNEGRDGHDVVEWFAKQPWCNGKVAMWGGSYAGFDQWSVVKEFPPHLSTIVPAAAAHPGIDFPEAGNIFSSYNIQWLTYVTGVTPNVKLFGEGAFWREKFREMYMTHTPFYQLDTLAGNPSPIFQKWMQHPHPDAYYDAMVPADADYKRFNLPILTITGHYDGDQPGAMEYYRRHMRLGSAEARAQHYLIIGPWDHAGTRTPSRDVGGLRFGQASMLDLPKLHVEWYDWTMKAGKKPEFLKKRVAYYVVGPGAEKWKYAEDIESIASERRVMYLQSDGHANDAFRSGTLSTNKPIGNAPPDSYTYDPLDKRPAELERESNPNYLTDQTDALNLFGNGVVYHSEPFAEPTEITGYMKLTVWLAMDVTDTDLEAVVYEIQPDGTSVALAQDRVRARYRESRRAEKLVTPGEITRFEFRDFYFFSRRVQKGSRLRLLLRCPNTIQLQKNYNSGGVVARESAKDARTAHIRVYHDAAHPSVLELPIVKE